MKLTDVNSLDEFFIGLIDAMLCSISLTLFIVIFAGAFIFLRRSGNCSSRNVVILTAVQMGLVCIVATTADVFGDDGDYLLHVFFVFIQPAIVFFLNLLLLLSTLVTLTHRTSMLESWLLKCFNYKW